MAALENGPEVAPSLAICQTFSTGGGGGGTGAAAVISLVIALLFISAWIEAQIGTLIAACWILTMILLIIGLIYFFRETRLAAVGVKSPHRLQNRFWKRTKRKHGGS